MLILCLQSSGFSQLFDDETNWVAETKIRTNSGSNEEEDHRTMSKINSKFLDIYYKRTLANKMEKSSTFLPHVVTILAHCIYRKVVKLYREKCTWQYPSTSCTNSTLIRKNDQRKVLFTLGRSVWKTNIWREAFKYKERVNKYLLGGSNEVST